MDKEAIKKEALNDILLDIKVLMKVCYNSEQTEEEIAQYGYWADCSICESYLLCDKLFGRKMPHDLLKD